MSTFFDVVFFVVVLSVLLQGLTVGPLAERLGFRYLDTGAMYRALTWLARRRGVAAPSAAAACATPAAFAPPRAA